MNRIHPFQNQNYEKIKKNLEEQKSLFVDNVFTATEASIGTITENINENEQIDWKRPRDLCDEPRLFAETGNRSSHDIQGGKLSTPNFLQALKILSGIKELVFKVIINSSEQAEFSSEKYIGMYRFRLWRFGEWMDVVIDDSLPCADGRLLFTNYSSPNIFWPCLLEKAYAKLLGSYTVLQNMEVSDVLVDLTGGVTEVLDLKSGEITSSEDDRALLFRSLNSEMSQHSIVCASIPAGDESGGNAPEGLKTDTTYHVTGVKKVQIQDMKLKNLFKGREKVAVIRIKDCGPVSDAPSTNSSPNRHSGVSSPVVSDLDSSPEDDARPISPSKVDRPLSRKSAWRKLKDRDHEKLGLTVDADGEFWLPFEDFCHNFRELAIVRMYNNNLFTRGPTWIDSQYRDEWKAPDRSGGGNSKSPTFFHNPQYLFDVKNGDDDIVFQILQEGGIEPSNSTPKHLPIGLTVFAVENNRRHRIHRLWGFTPKTVTVEHKRRRELTLRSTLHPGRYLLVPTALLFGSEGSFLIRAISQSNVKLRPIKRDIPHEPCGLSCIASPVVWVSVLSVKSAVGLPDVRDVFCVIKCERESEKTVIAQQNKGKASWEDAFVFYRRKPERHITVKVYAHNTLKRNQLLGFVELQAIVNHAPTNLEVALEDKEGGAFRDRKIQVELLTEDDLMAV